MSKQLIHDAAKIAINAHSGQFYGIQDYFSFHVQQVVHCVTCAIDNGMLFSGSLRDSKLNSYEIIAVAYLHDVVEDSDVTIQDIQKKFGNEIAYAVDAITKRKGEQYNRYIERVRMNKMAKFVKYYDVLINLEKTVDDMLNDETDTKHLKRFKKYMNALHMLG